MTVEILRAAPADLHRLSRVAPDVFDDEIRTDRAAAYLANPSSLMLLAVDDGQVVGQIRGAVIHHPDAADELYIENLGVTPALRRQGIATLLLAGLMDWARELGCQEAWVGTEVDNEAARGLYAKLGDVETFVGYAIEL